MSAEQEIQDAAERNDWEKVMWHAQVYTGMPPPTNVTEFLMNSDQMFTPLQSAISYTGEQKVAIYNAGIPLSLRESSIWLWRGNFYALPPMDLYNIMGPVGRKNLATTLKSMGLNFGNNEAYISGYKPQPKDTTVNPMLPYMKGSTDPIAYSIAVHKYDLATPDWKNTYAPWMEGYEALYRARGGFPEVDIKELRGHLTAICVNANTTLPAWLDRELQKRETPPAPVINEPPKLEPKVVEAVPDLSNLEKLYQMLKKLFGG